LGITMADTGCDEPGSNRNCCYRRGPYVAPAPGAEVHSVLDFDGRVIVVGDPHGCFDELMLLLDKCDVDPAKDKVVIVGDMPNKGPKSLEIIRYVRAKDHVLCIQGNHEGYALMWWDMLKAGTPAEKLPEVLQWMMLMTDEEAEWMRALPFSLRIPKHNSLIVHAGLVPDGRPLEEQHLGLLYRIRNLQELPQENGKRQFATSERHDIGTPWIDHWKGPEFVVFGHDSVRMLQQTEHAVGLDTGCCYGGQLSAFIFPDHNIVQVDALREYSAKVPK